MPVDWNTLEAHPKTWKWALYVCGFLFMMTNLSAFPRAELSFGTIVSGISLVALYGLAYERAIWSRNFWKAFFWVFTVVAGAFVILVFALTVANTADQFIGGLFGGPAAWFANSLVVLLALSFFGVQIRGLYLYAFKRKRLWTQKQVNG